MLINWLQNQKEQAGFIRFISSKVTNMPAKQHEPHPGATHLKK